MREALARTRLLRRLSGLAVAACLISVAPAAADVGWGMNLDGTPAGQPAAFSYQTNPYFTQLLGGPSCANPRAVCYVKIYVPWDAVNNGKGSFAARTCVASPTGPGTPAATFADELSAASRVVAPSHVLVSLTTSGVAGDDIWPTDAEYQCGLSGLEAKAPGVTEWEVFNEPDSNYVGAATASDCTRRNGVWVSETSQCAFGSPRVKPSGGNGHGGSAQGAAYWYLDAKQVDSRADHTLVAGGFNYGSSRCTPSTCYYLGGYMRVLSRIYPHPPDAVALNPYIDVSYAALNGGDPVPSSGSGLPSAQGAIAAIDHAYPTNPPIWLTEVGVWLTDTGREPVTSTCGDGDPADDGTWKGCVNGNRSAQALAAEGYLRLPSESPQIQRIYYYNFGNQNGGWDSALINMSVPLLGPERDGAPRTAWCVLHAFVRGASPDAAAREALQPGSGCDAPSVDVAYLSPTGVPAATPTPGEVGRDVILALAERVRMLAAITA